LEGAILDNADLRGGQLSGANLDEARLNGADLQGACLVKATLRNVEIEHTDFRHAWMMGATLGPLPRTLLDRVKPATETDHKYEKAGVIEAANFDQARLCGAMIEPGHWREDVSLGSANVSGGGPIYRPAALGDDRIMPGGFNAAPAAERSDGSVWTRCLAAVPEDELRRACQKSEGLSRSDP
jgi:hypothetical protein